MMPFFNPLAMMLTSAKGMQVLFEAQAVITMRVWGMAGIWSVTPAETVRMFAEKPVALSRAQSAATRAAMSGARPDQVAEAWLKPITRRAQANRRRLARRGPRVR